MVNGAMLEALVQLGCKGPTELKEKEEAILDFVKGRDVCFYINGGGQIAVFTPVFRSILTTLGSI